MTQEELQQAVQAAAQALEAGQTQDAMQRAEAILADAPGEATASQILAMIHLRGGRIGAAIPHLQAAEDAAPDHPPILNMLGVAFKQCGQRDEAREVFTRALAIDPNFIDLRLNLAQLDLDDGRLDEALTGFDAALGLQPDHPTALSGRARVGLLQHDLDAAVHHAEAALNIQPDNILAKLTLAEARLRGKDFDAARTTALEVADQDAAKPTNRAFALGFAADAEDHLGNYDEAFVTYTKANDILAELYKPVMERAPNAYSPQTLSRLMEYTKNAAAAPPPSCPNNERSPLFLVGFPRSGTTLLEQILLAHSKIKGLGEQVTLADACDDLVLADEGLERLARLDEQSAAHYRRQYWQRAADLGASPGEGELLLDKLPLNTVLLPVIAKIFPRAKILFALRDPRDVVLSCFQQRFGLNQAMYQFLNLTTAARYYDQAMRLGMAAREAYDFDLIDVRYDDVIANLEGVARSAVEHLGLDWEASILTYREGAKARVIDTPSVNQVIEPLYTNALDKWRNYEKHMTPVRDILDPWTVRFGYE